MNKIIMTDDELNEAITSIFEPKPERLDEIEHGDPDFDVYERHCSEGFYWSWFGRCGQEWQWHPEYAYLLNIGKAWTLMHYIQNSLDAQIKERAAQWFADNPHWYLCSSCEAATQLSICFYYAVTGTLVEMEAV